MECCAEKCVFADKKDVNPRFVACWLCSKLAHAKCAGLNGSIADKIESRIGLNWSCVTCRAVIINFTKMKNKTSAMFRELKRNVDNIHSKFEEYRPVLGDVFDFETPCNVRDVSTNTEASFQRAADVIETNSIEHASPALSLSVTSYATTSQAPNFLAAPRAATVAGTTNAMVSNPEKNKTQVSAFVPPQYTTTSDDLILLLSPVPENSVQQLPEPGSMRVDPPRNVSRGAIPKQKKAASGAGAIVASKIDERAVISSASEIDKTVVCKPVETSCPPTITTCCPDAIEAAAVPALILPPNRGATAVASYRQVEVTYAAVSNTIRQIPRVETPLSQVEGVTNALSNSSGPSLRVASPMKSIFVSRLTADTTEDEISDYISHNYKLIPKMMIYKFNFATTRDVASFKIILPDDDFKSIVNEQFWPSHVLAS